MRIKVKCTRPKCAKGEPEFDRLEDVAKWLCTIKGLAKGKLGRWLYVLAKSGTSGSHSMSVSIEMNSTFHDYSIAREIAFNVGLLKGGIGGDRFSSNRAVALEFAREIDKHMLDKGRNN